jgi:methyl-accepting chemotaxis protein PixJ
MTQNISPDPDNNKEISKSQSQQEETNLGVPDRARSSDAIEQQTRSEIKLQPKREKKQEAKRAELKFFSNSKKYLKAKAAATASAIVMLPILAMGTATYFLGNAAIDKQITIARRVDPTGLGEIELARQKQLLADLLIGTGVAALLAGTLAAGWASLSNSSAMRLATAAAESAAKKNKIKKRSQLVKEFIYNLQQSLDRQDIFQAAVSEAQEVLGCDRVVVYSVDKQSQGVVVAEAVRSNFPKALGATIQDPCFEARYIEQYRNGSVRVVNDIYQADWTQCYLEQLTSLKVRANLLVPILNEGKLEGLLVAHQCDAPRNWKQKEIDYLTQLAKRAGFVLGYANLAVDRDNLQLQLQQQTTIENQWTQYFTNTVGHIRASLKRQDILNITVEEVQKVLNCDRVVVYSTNAQSQGVIIAEAVTAGWTRALGKVIDDPCFEARYIEQYRDGRVRALGNIYESGMTTCYIEQLENLEVKANLVAPIINEGKLEGLLVAHQCIAPRAWQQHEIRWVAQIATQLGFVLEHTELIADYHRLQQQAEVETQWTHYLTDAIQYIRASLSREDIFQATVKEVRRILNCDRAVIYSMDRQSQGVVVAESVAPGWTRALGMTIEDPCFEARYMDKYRNGRVRALENIREAGLTSCYIEQLEVLEVKANLVTPVINEGKLLGLLVAHQCHAPRAWHHHEVRWMAQLATQVGFALDNASLLVNSDRLENQSETERQLTQYFTNAVRYIRDSLIQEDILDVATEEVRRILNCDRVVVYSLDRQSSGVIIAESVAPGWTRAKGITIKDPCFEARYIEKYRDGRVRALDNIREAGLTSCYIEQLEVLQVKANLVTPVINEGKLFGLLVAHQCSAPRSWQQHEIRWITQIATQVGFALDNAKLLRRLENEGKQIQLLKNFALRVGEADREEDLLEVSVEEARKAIAADRVIVYAFDRDWAGTVVAESVIRGFPKALRAKIKDPCFAQNYAVKYQNGRIQAIDNIYKAQLTDCHLEQLEPFAVKACAIVPILPNKQLFGLLIAHQCDAPRHWQESELDLLAQFALQLGSALDRTRLSQQLEQTSHSIKEPSDRKIQQQDRLEQKVSEILKESKTAYETLSQEVTRQSEAIVKFLTHLQTLNAPTKDPTRFSQQKALPAQREVPARQQENARIKNNPINIQAAISATTVKLKHLNQSYQTIFQMVSMIDSLRERVSHQTDSESGQTGEFDRASLISMAKAATPLINGLSAETAQIESSIAELVMATRQVAEAIDTDTQTQPTFEQTQLAPTNPVHLIQSAIIDPQIDNPDNLISQSSEQAQNSAFTERFVQEMAEIASNISEQSMAITESFNKLTEFTQDLGNRE